MNKKTNIAVMAFNLALLLAALVHEITLIAKTGIGEGLIVSILNSCACLFALLYVFYGCNKDAARFYHCFVCSFAVSAMSQIVILAGTVNNMPWQIATVATAFGVLCVLATSNDLGRTKSLCLGLVTFIECACALIINLIRMDKVVTLSALVSESTHAHLVTIVVLSIVLNLMIVAKYIDKASRGSK